MPLRATATTGGRLERHAKSMPGASVPRERLHSRSEPPYKWTSMLPVDRARSRCHQDRYWLIVMIANTQFAGNVEALITKPVSTLVKGKTGRTGGSYLQNTKLIQHWTGKGCLPSMMQEEWKIYDSEELPKVSRAPRFSNKKRHESETTLSAICSSKGKNS